MNSYKLPPVWADDQSFDSWWNEVSLWKLVTDLEQSKIAVAVALSLTGRRREVAMEVPNWELAATNGLDKLHAKLENVFGVDTNDAAFACYDAFESLKRGDMTVIEYVRCFEAAYAKVRKHKMVLPDNVMACKLLRSASLEVKERQMVLASTSQLTFDSMKQSLKRIFGSEVSKSTEESVELKCEPAFTATEEAAFYAGEKRKWKSQNNSGHKTYKSKQNGG